VPGLVALFVPSRLLSAQPSDPELPQLLVELKQSDPTGPPTAVAETKSIGGKALFGSLILRPLSLPMKPEQLAATVHLLPTVPVAQRPQSRAPLALQSAPMTGPVVQTPLAQAPTVQVPAVLAQAPPSAARSVVVKALLDRRALPNPSCHQKALTSPASAGLTSNQAFWPHWVIG
jgi:hypothetical protein